MRLSSPLFVVIALLTLCHFGIADEPAKSPAPKSAMNIAKISLR